MMCQLPCLPGAFLRLRLIRLMLSLTFSVPLVSGWVEVSQAQSRGGSPARSPIPASTPSAQRTITCNTDGYVAQISWQQGQPRLTFGRSLSQADIKDTPVQQNNRSGIATYTTSQGEAKTQVFVYLDGTCAVTVTNAAGEVTVNELGNLASARESMPVVPPVDTTLLTFQTSKNAVRVYTRNGQILINVYNKQDKVTWLNGVPVNAERTPEGIKYTTVRGESTVEVLDPSSNDIPTLTINGAIDPQ